MKTNDIIRQASESGNSLNRINGYTEDYPSFPSLCREMTNWVQDWDNLLGEFLGPRWNWQNRPGLALTTASNATRFSPAIDIREGENGYTITAELPGIDPKYVERSVQEGTLLITGEKKFEQENKGGRRLPSRGALLRLVPQGHRSPEGR